MTTNRAEVILNEHIKIRTNTENTHLMDNLYFQRERLIIDLIRE